MQRARLGRYGLLSVTGEDARAFLHAQLTNDVEHMSAERAALAGWCSAKGRLLATFLVIPSPQGFLLQLARDLAAPVAKRLSLFILRAKVKIADESESWNQYGVWDADYPDPQNWMATLFGCNSSNNKYNYCNQQFPLTMTIAANDRQTSKEAR